MDIYSVLSPQFFHANFSSGWNDSLKFCTLRIYIRFQSWAKSQNCPIYLISFRNILLCGLKFSHITLHSTQKSLCWRLCFLLLCYATQFTDRTEDRTQASRDESIECKNEVDSFPQLIDLIFTEQMYLYWNIHIVQNSWQVCV